MGVLLKRICVRFHEVFSKLLLQQIIKHTVLHNRTQRYSFAYSSLSETNMKLFVYYAAILSLLSSSQGFTPSFPKSQTYTNLRARADSSSAIDDAMQISKEYGYGSSQAQVAWDIVEEIDASDNL